MQVPIHKVNDHITNFPCESYWTIISITKYTGKWFDLSLNSSYWIKLFFSLKIIADLRCPFKLLPSEFTSTLHVSPAIVGNRKGQYVKCAKAVCGNGKTQGFGFTLSEFKSWFLFCLTDSICQITSLYTVCQLYGIKIK